MIPITPILLLSFVIATLGRATDAAPSLHGSGLFVETPSGRLYYEVEGNGPPLILVAGGPGASHASFHPWFSRLADAFTVVYFDNLGRGRSDRLTDPTGYTVERDAEDIEALRRALGFERFGLLGHSYGGMPALAYAMKHGDRLTALVLSDTAHGAAGFQENIDHTNQLARDQFPEVWGEIMAMRARGVKSTDSRYQEIYGRAEGDLYWFDITNAAKLYRSGQAADGFNYDVYRSMLGDDPEWIVGGTLRDWDARPGMAALPMPVLICVGRYDRLATPKIALEMKAALRATDARVEIFERSGHRPWLEESDRYFATLRQFLNTTVRP